MGHDDENGGRSRRPPASDRSFPQQTNQSPPPSSPSPAKAGKIPQATWGKLGLALVVGLMAVLLVPRAGGDGRTVPVNVLLATGLAVGVVAVGAMYLALTRDMKLPTTVVAYALTFNLLIILVKFVLAPQAIYQVNLEVPFSSLISISEPWGAMATGIFVLLLYAAVYWAIYRLFRLRLMRKAKKLRERLAAGGRVLTIFVGASVVLAMTGGAVVILVPLIAAGSAFEYLDFVFTSATSLIITVTLTSATALTAMAFNEASERAALVGDVAVFVSFFWVGLCFLALYHVLWVVYILVLTSIWPLKVVVPK